LEGEEGGRENQKREKEKEKMEGNDN